MNHIKKAMGGSFALYKWFHSEFGEFSIQAMTVSKSLASQIFFMSHQFHHSNAVRHPRKAWKGVSSASKHL